jgi:AcrR family transcriptional regulator
VGVTEPVVFQNFGTKSDLFVAVLERVADEVTRYLAALGEQSTTVAELLSRLLAQEHQDRIHSAGGLGMIFLEAASNPEPVVREAGHRAHTRTVQAVADLLRRGQAEGSIRDDVDALTLGWLVLSQIHAGQFRRAHTSRSPNLEQAMLDALLAVLGPAHSPKSGP